MTWQSRRWSESGSTRAERYPRNTQWLKAFQADGVFGRHRAAPTEAGRALLRAGLEGMVARLPGHLDPDEFVRAKGRPALEALLSAASPLTEFLLEYFTRQRCPDGVKRASAEQRLRAVRDLTPYVAASVDEAFRTLFVKRIARNFDLDIGVLRAEVGRTQAQRR